VHGKIKNSLSLMANDLINNNKDCFPESFHNFSSNCCEFENFTYHLRYISPNSTEVLRKIIIYGTFFHGNFIPAFRCEQMIEFIKHRGSNSESISSNQFDISSFHHSILSLSSNLLDLEVNNI
jgi:hypothetical protein